MFCIISVSALHRISWIVGMMHVVGGTNYKLGTAPVVSALAQQAEVYNTADTSASYAESNNRGHLRGRGHLLVASPCSARLISVAAAEASPATTASSEALGSSDRTTRL